MGREEGWGEKGRRGRGSGGGRGGVKSNIEGLSINHSGHIPSNM